MRSAALALLLVVAGPATSLGADASIHGTVSDPQGAAIAGARIEIVCGATRRQLRSDAAGVFTAAALPETRCTVVAESPLFDARTVIVDLTRETAATATLVLPLRAYAELVVVTPTRGIEVAPFRVPEAISITTREDIESRPYQLLPQVLREEPGILIQQTTTAQASPIIRGFTGQSNMYLLDGVRFNAASWRSGPSQYLGWIDAAVAERLEIVRGPGSVQYGSDALGGTINVLTLQPSLSASGTRVGGEFQAALGSADTSAGGRAGLRIEGPRAAFHLGGGTVHVNNLRTGRGVDSHAAVTRFLGLPSSVLGSRLRDTGFEQSGAHLIGHIRAGASADIRTVYLHEAQRGASRYDRVAGGEALYRSGFEPQALDFGLVRYERRPAAGFDAWSATFSYNRQADGRFEQARPTAILDRQQATTTALGYQFEGRRRFGRHEVVAGAELYDESIAASREQVNPIDGSAVANRPDIPDGTGYVSAGAFAQAVSELVPGRVFVRGGLRYGRFNFSTRADPQLGVIAETVAAQALTFSVGAVFGLTKHLNATFSVGRGFRAANAADLGGIGLTGGGGFEITPSRAAALEGFIGSTAAANAVSTGAPVPVLQPEVVYSFEPGLKFSSRRFSAAVSVYDMEYLDAIQRRAVVFDADIVGSTIAGYQVVRQDPSGLAYIAQDLRPIGTRVNLEHARIVGFEAEADARLTAGWIARAYVSASNGRLLDSGEFLRRMPPPLGGAALKWSRGGTWVEGVVSVAARQTRFNSGDLTDARIGGVRTRASIATYFNGTATDLGLVRNGVLLATGETLAHVQNRVLGTASSGYLYTDAPGYVVYGLRAGWRASSQIDLTLIGENLTDRNYRSHGSGVDAPGFNVQLRTRYRF